jgi:hypothetical protein
LFSSREHWRYAFECLDKSSKQIQISCPLSLNLSASEAATKGMVNESSDDDEECVASINENQLITPNRQISFDSEESSEHSIPVKWSEEINAMIKYYTNQPVKH